MYGTVAWMRLKPGAEAELERRSREFESLNIPGFIFQYVYRMDNEPDVYYLVVAFENKDLYFQNANSPEQAERYGQIRALLEEDPQWHDGEIVVAFNHSRTESQAR